MTTGVELSPNPFHHLPAGGETRTDDELQTDEYCAVNQSAEGRGTGRSSRRSDDNRHPPKQQARPQARPQQKGWRPQQPFQQQPFHGQGWAPSNLGPPPPQYHAIAAQPQYSGYMQAPPQQQWAGYAPPQPAYAQQQQGYGPPAYGPPGPQPYLPPPPIAEPEVLHSTYLRNLKTPEVNNFFWGKSVDQFRHINISPAGIQVNKEPWIAPSSDLASLTNSATLRPSKKGPYLIRKDLCANMVIQTEAMENFQMLSYQGLKMRFSASLAAPGSAPRKDPGTRDGGRTARQARGGDPPSSSRRSPRGLYRKRWCGRSPSGRLWAIPRTTASAEAEPLGGVTAKAESELSWDDSYESRSLSEFRGYSGPGGPSAALSCGPLQIGFLRSRSLSSEN